MKKLVLITLAACAAIGASADTLGPYVISVGPSLTDQDFNVLLPKFDPALGTLNSVSYDISATIDGAVGGENRSLNPTTIKLTLGGDVTIDFFPAVPVVVIDQSFVVTGFDGTADFGGTSGKSFVGADTEGVVGVYTLPGDLAPFIGVGDLGIVISGDSISTAIIGSGNGEAFAATRFAANLKVTYDYTPYIPEPGTYLGALGLLGVGVAGYRRMRKA